MKQETVDYLQKVLNSIDGKLVSYENLLEEMEKSEEASNKKEHRKMTVDKGIGYAVNLGVKNLIETIIQMESTEDE